MTTLVEFEVIGVPCPQGSMKAFAVGGRAMVKPSGGLKFAQWRNAVAQAGHDLVVTRAGEWAAEVGGGDFEFPLDGALGLSVEFRFPMPAGRPKAVREYGRAWKTTAPDTDKLIRCIGDALTASGLITDDARFVAVEATKVETTGWTGAIVTITREDGTP